MVIFASATYLFGGKCISFQASTQVFLLCVTTKNVLIVSWFSICVPSKLLLRVCDFSFFIVYLLWWKTLCKDHFDIYMLIYIIGVFRCVRACVWVCWCLGHCVLRCVTLKSIWFLLEISRFVVRIIIIDIVYQHIYIVYVGNMQKQICLW